MMNSQFSGAVFDDAKRFRFLLWRFWDDRPKVLFIGANPSTADEWVDDPTSKRAISFAKQWGYGGIYLCNVLPCRATDPKALASMELNHVANLPAVKMANRLSAQTVLFWGDCLKYATGWQEFAGELVNILQGPVKCFGKTASGNPKHIDLRSANLHSWAGMLEAKYLKEGEH